MSYLWGYLDPGVGSILLQVVAAAVLSVTVMFRHYVFSPCAWLFGKKKDPTEETP